MGKQAKKKDKSAAQASGQRKHNRKTRGVNSSKKPVIHSAPVRRVKDRATGQEIEVQEYIIIPHRTMWDPWDASRMDADKAQLPWSDLHIDWQEELMHYAAEQNAKISSTPIGDGKFLHSVYIMVEGVVGDKKAMVKRSLCEVVSSRPLMISKFARRA